MSSKNSGSPIINASVGVTLTYDNVTEVEPAEVSYTIDTEPQESFNLQPHLPICSLDSTQVINIDGVTNFLPEKRLPESSSRYVQESSTTQYHSDCLKNTESTTERYSNKRICYIFLFYNPTSGGNAASVLADPELRQADLYFSNQHVRLSLWDIRDGKKLHKPGFLRLKEIIQRVDQHCDLISLPIIRVIVAGGDGTVMWCISELRSHGIDLTRIVIGVIPFGTGNDFARALFWEMNLAWTTTNPKKLLRHLVSEWLEADIIQHDLWQVDISVLDTGVFKRVDSVTRAKHVLTTLDEHGHVIPVRQASFKMCNYFSIGVESRIGVGFDRYRTTSQFWNKLRYAAEGLKKSMFKHTLKINEIVSRMIAYESDTHTSNIIFRCPNPVFVSTQLQESSQWSPARSFDSLESGENSYTHQHDQHNILQVSSSSFEPLLSQSQHCLASSIPADLNIFVSSLSPGSPATERLPYSSDNCLMPQTPSLGNLSLPPNFTRGSASAPPSNLQLIGTSSVPYLAPAASLIAVNIPSFAAGLDIWKSAYRLGVGVLPDGSGELRHSLEHTSHMQRLGDGILEFLTFSSAASMGFERMTAFHGRGKKVYQGRGPFEFLFHHLPRACRVYFQVDGEFYVMNCPHKISLSHDSTINVLASPLSPYRENYIVRQSTK